MGKKNKRQKTKDASSAVETEEEVRASSKGRAGDDEGGDCSPLIAPRKRGRPRKIAAEKEEEDDEGEMGGVGKKKQQVKEEEDSTRSRARRKSIPRKSS